MESPSSRLFSSRPQPPTQPDPESASMTALALRPPTTTFHAPRDMWRRERSAAMELPSRPRPEAERADMTLPSIRTAVPQIMEPTARDRTDPRLSYSPTATGGPGPLNVPLENPQKRRRTDEELGLESRDRAGSRVYRQSPPTKASPRSIGTTFSPPSSARRESVFSNTTTTTTTTDSWTGSTRSSPFMPPGGLPAMRAGGSPPPFDSNSITRSDWRPQLPSIDNLPSLSHNAAPGPPPRTRSNFSEYALESSPSSSSSRSGAQTYPQISVSTYEAQVPATPAYPLRGHATFAYGYQQPRGQSFSGPSHYVVTHDRSPFYTATHHNPYPGAPYNYVHDAGDVVNDSRQRKRRGNLPKETTDKLRAWFHAHLQHPYPTEDEKQELMRQTHLQMNQISNWFINARRRQLPAMINNARAEEGARSSRSGEAGLRPASTSDYGDEKEKRGSPMGDSEGDGSAYGDEYDGQGMNRSKRESI